MTAPPAGPRARRQQELDALEPVQPPSWDAGLEGDDVDDGRHEARLFVAFLVALAVIFAVAWLAGA